MSTRWVSAASSRRAKDGDDAELERAAAECARMKEWTDRSCNNIKALVLILVPHDSAQERFNGFFCNDLARWNCTNET